MESEVWAAEMGEAPEVDLHTLPKDEALLELERFLHHELLRDTRVIKIIHGRGSGKLRESVHTWLKQQPSLVLYFRDSNNPGQIGAVTLAYLERIRPSFEN